MKKETIMRIISVPTAKGLCGARRVAMMLLMTMLTSVGAWAAILTNFPTASGGEGTSENPYKISSTSDLDKLAEDVNNGITYQDVYFKLTQNITYSTSGLSETESNYTPIGGYDGDNLRLFKGHFDGDGKTISGIRIYRSGNSNADKYLGLFGCIEGSEGNKAEVKGVTLKNTKITGHNSCGGIVGGSAQSVISNCHVSNDVTIHAIVYLSCRHGGIVGLNGTESTISGCTSDATISKAEDPNVYDCKNYGAIAGCNDGGTIQDCLALNNAKVTGTSYVGAIVGYNTGTLTNNGYTRFGVFGVGANGSLRGSDQTGAQFVYVIYSEHDPSGWNSQSSYTDGITVYNNGLKYGKPVSGSEYNNYYKFATMTDCWGLADGNDGSEDHHYVITTTTGLDLLADQVNKRIYDNHSGKYFDLGADITYSYTHAYNSTSNDNATYNNYTPIGIKTNENFQAFFSGIFDGKGHMVKGIRYYCNTNYRIDSYKGLFATVLNGGVVKNVNLDDARITGYQYCGGIAGECNGTISNCHVGSEVVILANYNLSSYHGGIAGGLSSNNNEVSITGCTSAATLTNNNKNNCGYYGGIVGENKKSTVQDCLYLGTSITGNGNVGAIAGSNDQGTITNNYYTASGLGGVGGTDTDGAKYAISLSCVPPAYNIGAEGTTYGESTYTGITAYANGLKYNSKYYLPITPVVLSLADNDDNSTALSTNNGDLANVTLDGRTLYCDGDWNTLTLPFSLTAEEIAASPLADLTIKKLNGSESGLAGGTLTLNFEDATTIEAGKPYLVKWAPALIIKNKADWNAFCQRVNNNYETFEGKVVKLADDYDNSGDAITWTVGMPGHPFKGTFDGNGRTLTVGYNTGTNYLAPFRYVDGATIKNLTIAGSFIDSKKLLGGLVGSTVGNTTISNCRVSATVESTVSGDGTVGGFVAIIDNGHTTIENCLFDGSFVGTNTRCWSGFVGWVECSATQSNNDIGTGGSLSVINSLFAPTSVTISSHDNNCTVYRSRPGYTPTLTKCYYKTTAFNAYQGEDASGMSKETLLSNLGSGWEISGDNVVPKMNVKITGTDIVNPVFENVIIDNTENPVNFTGGSFVGNYAPLAINDANRKSIVLLAAGNKLGYAKTDRTLGAFRAYFDIPSVAGAPAINSYELNFGEDSDENTTGIIEVNTNNTNLTNKAEGVFDLQGRRVEKPAKGLYIVNGKKVVIK